MRKKKSANYIDPAELESEIVSWQQTGKMSDQLGRLFLTLVRNVAKRMNFIAYSNFWKEEMEGNAILTLCKYAKHFDSNHPRKNVFSYCTKIVYRAFQQILSDEKLRGQVNREIFEEKKNSGELIFPADTDSDGNLLDDNDD